MANATSESQFRSGSQHCREDSDSLYLILDRAQYNHVLLSLFLSRSGNILNYKVYNMK
jgi:hypothetical protein